MSLMRPLLPALVRAGMASIYTLIAMIKIQVKLVMLKAILIGVERKEDKIMKTQMVKRADSKVWISKEVIKLKLKP